MKLNANTTVYAKWTENAVTPTLPFTDVKSGDWFYEAVQYVYDKGMMTGVSADRFAPASTTTRGMIVTILYRLENEPAVSGGSAFTDVENGAWYADAVVWAAANDIVNGTSATTFPQQPHHLEQMAAILYRYAAYKGYDVSQKADLSGYTDAAFHQRLRQRRFGLGQRPEAHHRGDGYHPGSPGQRHPRPGGHHSHAAV